MLKYGYQGYKEKARKILTAQKEIRKALTLDKDFKVTSIHDSPIISFSSPTVNAIAICELMSKKHNWQISKLQKPPGAHLAITDANQESW